jgi:hypothetical protein
VLVAGQLKRNRSGGIEGRPTSLYICSNSGESPLSAASASGLIRLIGWLAGTRFSGFTKVSIVLCGRSHPRILCFLLSPAGLLPLYRLIRSVDPIAGEFFNSLLNFAQAEPWQSKDLESSTSDGIPLCFTEEQSLEKLKGIVSAHRAVFDGLARLASAKANHQVVILPGNHDADFFWDLVRAKFMHVVSGGDRETAQRVRFHLQRAHRPEDFPRVWIEHRHQYDDCNKFMIAGTERWANEAKPILADKKGVPRLLECVGARFLIKFMNALDADYPFVDNVKPFSKFVKMFLASSVSRGFGPIKAAIAYWRFLKFFASTLGKSPKDLLSTGDDRCKLLRKFAELGSGSRAGCTWNTLSHS